MLRLFDVVFSLLGLVLCLPLLAVLSVVGLLDTGLPFFRQRRVGKNKKTFTLVKFRTMRPGTVSVASHLADPAAVTSFGAFLRRTKLDELPQLWNVFKGEMSLVGPRPCLPNQVELIAARDRRGVFAVRPGITGLAQVNGVDMSDPEHLAELDALMVKTLTVPAYFRYLFLTLLGRGGGDRIRAK